MFHRMLFANAIRVPKALTTVAVSLVFFLAALPAHAQQQDQYRIVWIGHPVVIIVGLILVLLAAIGAMVIFVWLVAGQPAATHFMTRVFAAATPPSTSLKSALLGARLTRPSTKTNAS